MMYRWCHRKSFAIFKMGSLKKSWEKANLRNRLIKSKVPPPPPKRKTRDLPGMKKCNKPGCGACPFILEGKEVKSSFNATSVKINCPVNCQTQNLVYVIFCNKENCKQLYIGKTERKLKERLAEHLNAVKKNKKKCDWSRSGFWESGVQHLATFF